MNSIKGQRNGKNILRFSDGTMMTYSVPEMVINGLLMGERTINYSGSMVVKDFKNKIEGSILFAYKEDGTMESIKNSITGLFKSKEKKIPSDDVVIQILQVNPTTKQKDFVSEGSGSWLGEIIIDSKRFILIKKNVET